LLPTKGFCCGSAGSKSSISSIKTGLILSISGCVLAAIFNLSQKVAVL